MAVGFIAALLAYGSLLLPTTAAAYDSMPPSATRSAAHPRTSVP
jgi:hypothetical protein